MKILVTMPRAVMGASAAACLSAALLAPSPAAAQVALPSRQQLDPANAAPIAAAPRGDLFKGVQAGPCAFRDSPIKITLKAVDFQGGTTTPLALSDQALASTYAEFIGREAPLSVACDIRDRVAALYLRRGVLANVVIPEQRIADGRLTLAVVEARIVSVNYHGDAGPAQKQVVRFLDHLRGMAPFDLDVAQRYLLLASDVPGVRIQSALKPSPHGQGAMDLEVAISRDAVDGSVASQNYGSKTVGRDLTLARLDLNGFTPLGERTSILGYGTLSSDEQRVIQVAERFFIGGDGLTADLSGAWGWTKPGDILKPLDLEGESFAGNVRLTYPLVRHRNRNLNIGVGLDWIDQKVEFGGGLATLTEDHLRVFFLRLDGHYAPASLAAHSVAMTGVFELRQGSNGLGASRYGDLSASRFLGKPKATVMRTEGEIGGRLAGPVIGKLNVLWQHTDDPLLSYEEYGIGNLTIGRGYDPSAAAGDRALAASLELSTVPLPIRGGRAAWRPYAFYDLAELTNLGIGAGKLDLTSAGVGVRAQLTSRVAVDLTWAKPFDSPFGVGDAPSSRVLVSLSAALF
ncbi:ShlB/FhaC/HecB family hemolysin secretion/activation protein [Caulobacter endophyticus]|uniref:ShlB/FhaC/HecB family hemolysin secretion/activation protein n=1 Tax=Caulobacter endophyticus TaxID=2172652 RepID=UPI00240F14A7|nr:ShlB/FhaC/HecB family hemolysin secretion/activation protein [Caulobacter endophyticus]MDG2527910.1 ShlB/FhaC/HecB family hemolysin secretion/activation protein [Caulobacter endophyticus]